MELLELIRSTNTCRYYTGEPVSDEVLEGVLNAARFAPSGGNRQPVSVVVVRSAAKKRALKELYLPIWNAYVDGIGAGEVRVGGLPKLVEDADHFARHMDEIPVMLVVCARLADVHPTDTGLDRLSIVGGASIYPAVQNMLLAARSAGLGSALTTLLCAVEPQVKALLEIPEDVSTAAMVTMGWPVKPFPTKLRRRPLSEMAFVDRYGDPFGA